MTKITQIYDAIVSKIESTMPAYKRMPNAYFVEDNNDLVMRKGFAVAIREGTQRSADITCGRYIWERFYEVILSNVYHVNENDADARGAAEIALLEDRELVFKAFRQDIQLTNGTATVNTIDSDFQSDGGIEFLQGTKTRHLVLRLDLFTLYEDNIL